MNMMTENALEKAVAGKMSATPNETIKMRGDKVGVFYGDKQALFDVDLDIRENQVTALIGPSGCGKSTFLRCLNRMNDTIDSAASTGKITLDGEDIYDQSIDVVELRARVGMVFQKPNPFPKSIYENVAYGPRIHGLAKNKAELDEIVESSLQKAALWNEVKDRLQRARHRPFRRPAAAPVHRARHRRQPGSDPDGRAVLGARSDRHRQGRGADRRAARRTTPSSSSPTRCSRRRASRSAPPCSTSAIWSRKGATDKMFTNPDDKRTQDYITGRFG